MKRGVKSTPYTPRKNRYQKPVQRYVPPRQQTTGEKSTPEKPKIITDDMIDYVLVHKKHDDNPKRTTFLNNMLRKGFIINHVEYEEYNTLVFIKVHLPTKDMIEFASNFNIPLKMKQAFNTVHYHEKPFSKLLSLNYYRTMETPSTLTSHERQFIVYQILKMIPYGIGKDNVGITDLIETNVFTDAFVLHDGDYKWPRDVNIKPTDRQLLYQFWTSFKFICDKRAVMLTEKYYGSDIGMYFYLSNFYIKMLCIASLFGIIYGGVMIGEARRPNTYVKEGCELDNVTICPYCMYCEPTKLSDYCSYFFLSAVMDHGASLWFSFGISIWAYLFVKLWSRQESILRLKWQLKETNFDSMNTRPEFIAAASVRVNFYNQEEYFVPSWMKIYRLVLGKMLTATLTGLILFITAGVIYSEAFWNTFTDSRAINILIVSSINEIFVEIVPKTYDFIVNWITKLEIKETEAEFDHSYILKLFLFCSINALSGVVYMTFFNGRFYTYPSDPRFLHESTNIFLESCRPYGCAPEVFLFLSSKVITKFVFAMIQAQYQYIQMKAIKSTKKDKTTDTVLKNYKLKKPDVFLWAKRYNELVIQYGLIVMFGVAFPLTPLLELVTIVLDTRRQAVVILTTERRTVGKRRTGLGSWFIILTYLSNLAIMTNGFYITFTTGLLGKLMHRMTNRWTLTGYLQSVLSEFNKNETIWPTMEEQMCYYMGNRYPQGHPHQYQLTRTYTFLLGIKLSFLIMCEHVVLATTVMLQCIIPELPRIVKEFSPKNDDRRKSTIFSPIHI